VRLSLESRESYFFIVNYHALTTVRDADALSRYTFDVALDYLALGFDAERSHLFAQTDVPEVTELAWIFQCLTPVARLELGVSYKDKVDQGLPASAGLLSYPLLQAADILIYGGTQVPVGADQRQHVEMTRDAASRFNQAWSPDAPVFPEPEALILDEVAVVPGTDGRKMSKSYGNAIGIFDEGNELKDAVMSIVTDSTPLEEPKDPEKDNVFALIKLFAEPADRHFTEARERRRELAGRPEDVRDILAAGAAGARTKAQGIMKVVREKTGLVRFGVR
jgi:tryptophanyl-tRNA synthetase